MRKYIYYLKSFLNHREFVSLGFLWLTIVNTFKARVLKIPRLRNVQMALTFRCNHSCTFCSSNKLLKKDKKELHYFEWQTVIDQLKSLGVIHFDLTGGEPTLHNYLGMIIDYIQDGKGVISLATNGKNLDADKIEFYKTCGLTVVEFNLQSVNPEIHDARVRDKGNFQHIMTLIPIAQKYGLKVCINTCLGDDNWDEIEKLMDWCEKSKIHCLLNLGAPTGRLQDKDVRITDRKAEYYRLLYSHPYSRSDTSYNYRGLNLCPGGVEKVYITAYGEVQQCTFCQISFGNVRKDPLSLIYRRFLSQKRIVSKEICKHTFNETFRKEWINPIIDHPNPPIALTDHPCYENENTDPATYKKTLGFLFNYLIKQKSKELQKWIKRSEWGYDIGAGFGQYARQLQKLGYHVVAVEPDARYLKDLDSFSNCKAEDVNLELDYAYLINVLHHANDPVGVLAHLKTKVKRIIISELNRRSLFVRLYVKLLMKHENINSHYSKSDVEDILRASGLNVKHRYTTSLLGVPYTYNWWIIE